MLVIMVWRVLSLVAFVALLLAFPGGAGAVKVSDERLREIVEEVYADGDYQTEFPDEVIRGEDAPQSAEKRSWDVCDSLPSVCEFMDAIGPVYAQFLRIALITFAFVGISILAFALFGEIGEWTFLSRQREGEAAGPAAGERAVETLRPAGELLAEAEELARAGAFTEAIHQLLLCALSEVRSRLDPDLAPALTSREILRRETVAGAVRDALSQLVAAAEMCHFAGRPANEAGYRHCRQTLDQVFAATGGRA